MEGETGTGDSGIGDEYADLYHAAWRGIERDAGPAEALES